MAPSPTVAAPASDHSVGPSMGTLTVTLNTIEDSLAEGPERYRLNIANASSTTGISPVIAPTGNSVTTTITDDDMVKWSLVGHTSVDEGATASYMIGRPHDLPVVSLAILDWDKWHSKGNRQQTSHTKPSDA